MAATFLVAGAAFVLGVFIGCLFGVPQHAVTTPEQVKEGASKAGLYRPSNQLQQVSDWLVKILLGASLTQLGNVTVIGAYFGELVGSGPAAMVIITYFFVTGFLAGYFVMVVYLGGLIRDAGEDLVTKYAKESDLIRIVYRLYQALYSSPVELDQAIKDTQDYVDKHQTDLNVNPKVAGDIYGQLACGYAQQFERLPATNDAERKSLLKKALDSAKKAIEYDINWSGVLVDLYDAGPERNDNNDWAIFKVAGNDPEQEIKLFVDSLRRG